MRKFEKTGSQKNHLERDLLIGQVNHMAELVDRLRLQIKEQRMAIVARDQHINNLNKTIAARDQHINNVNKAIAARDQHINNVNKNLNKAIAAKDEHIANLDRFIRNLTGEIVKIKKYSVFYNLLSRFRKELLMWFSKSRK